jgi:hypothetical protein
MVAAPIANNADWTTEGLLLPPGMRIRAALTYLCSKRTMQSVVEPLLADMQAEWLDAMAANRHVLALAIRLRGYLSLAQNLGLKGLIRFAVDMCSGPAK